MSTVLLGRLCYFGLVRAPALLQRGLATSSVLLRETYKMGEKGSPTRRDMRGTLIDESDNETKNIDALSQMQQGGPEPENEDADTPPSSAADDFQALPDMETLDQLFDGVPYRDLPFVHVRCTKNNTRLWAFDAEGKQLEYCVPYEFGFANAAKRTNVAAQVTAMNMGQRLRNRNIRTVRVRVEGFNNGRVASLKGLVQAGTRVVSVTDLTHVDWGWTKRAKHRPRVN